MRAIYPFVIVIFAIIVVSISGCSLNPLSSLTDKPEVTAQVGGENVKQTVGVTAKRDDSSKQDISFRGSDVGKVDSSSKKQISNSSIKAGSIKAEKIEIRNGMDDLYPVLFCIACFFIAGFMSGVLWAKRKKEA